MGSLETLGCNLAVTLGVDSSRKRPMAVQYRAGPLTVEAVLAPEALAVPQRQHILLLLLPRIAPFAQRDGIVGTNVLAAVHCR